MKARVYQEVDVADWLRGQVEAGCTQLRLLSHNFSTQSRLCEWPLYETTDVAALTEEVEQAVTSGRSALPGIVLLSLFSYRPERWAPLGMALFLEGPPL